MLTTPWALPTPDGGHQTEAFDLFPTFAVAEALDLARETVAFRDQVVGQLLALGRRGGIGSARGQAAETWSTSYRVLLLHRFGAPQVRDDLTFLLGRSREGVATMDDHEGQSVWSAAFAGQALALGFDEVPDLLGAVAWAASCQAPDGGMAWAPDGVPVGDVRAAAFLLRWMSAIRGLDLFLDRIDADALVRSLQGLQREDGGFALTAGDAVADLWGLGYGVEALSQLGAAPLDPAAATNFAIAQRTSEGGFRRGPGHPGAEVWSDHHAMQLVTAGVLPAVVVPGIVAHLRRCEAPDGRVGHRPVGECSDAYTTSGVALGGLAPDPERALDLLEDLRLPDGGYSYMRARGSEARSTRFATAALLAAGRPVDARATLGWILSARNPDGAWGIYGGRSSTPNATCAVLATADALGLLEHVVVPDLAIWVKDRWARADEHGEDLVLRSLLARIAGFAGTELDLTPLRTVLHDHRATWGWHRTASGPADLVTTYQALLAVQLLGELDDHLALTAEWVRTLEREDGTAFTPRAAHGGGALPTALGRLIRAAADGVVPARLVELTL